MISHQEFETRLHQALSHYRDTISQVNELLELRKSIQDIILLVCARIDSLSNLAFYSSPSQHHAFINFLSNYSGLKKFFNAVSVGDLYRFLAYYGDLADGGLIGVPGRVRRFGPDSEIFLAFIEQSMIPITGESVRVSTEKICKVLARYFRVKPYQRRDKPYLTSPSEVIENVSRQLRHPQRDHIVEALQELVDRFKCHSILYRRYRNQSIHGLQVGLNPRDFFEEESPIHARVDFLDGSIFQISFPGLFLRDLLSKCLDTYQGHLLAKKKLPLDLFNVMFSFDELLQGGAIEYIEDEALYDFEEVRWRLQPR